MQRLGERIDDKYRLVAEIGVGGMGRVFLAEHLVLGTRVALKFMHPHLAAHPGSVERFIREARAAATLTSDHAARILDMQGGADPYIVMEYLHGESLESVVKERRGLGIETAVRFVIQACDALGEAHARRIVHRDVKPANLFVTRDRHGAPTVKVLDFGLAISDGSPEAVEGGVERALGTPHYMSPEQIHGGTLDHRSDIWSLGVTLQDLMTGRRAFRGGTTAAVFARILEGFAQPVQQLRPDVSDAIAEVIDRCLRRDPAERFASMQDLAHALANALVSDRGSRASLTSVATPIVMSISQIPPAAPTRAARSWSLAALGGPLLVAVTAAGLALSAVGARAAAAPASPRSMEHVSTTRGDDVRAKRTAPTDEPLRLRATRTTTRART